MFYYPKKVYFLDEVTSGLEYGLAKSIEETILRDADSTIVHISHRSDETIINRYDAIISMSSENGIFLTLFLNKDTTYYSYREE